MDTKKISLKQLKNLEKDRLIRIILDLHKENIRMNEVLSQLKEMIKDLQDLIQKDFEELAEMTKKDEKNN